MIYFYSEIYKQREEAKKNNFQTGKLYYILFSLFQLKRCFLGVILKFHLFRKTSQNVLP